MKIIYFIIIFIFQIILFSFLYIIDYFNIFDFEVILSIVLQFICVITFIVFLNQLYVKEFNEKFKEFKEKGFVSKSKKYKYKKVFSLFVFICLFIIAFPIVNEYSNKAPRYIYNINDFMKIEFNPKKHYILMNDIDMSKYCTEYKNKLCSGKSFDGVLDGNGHSIDNLNVPLFSAITKNGVIKNLKITNANIDSSKDDIGIVANLNQGVIENVQVNGYIKGHEYIGGLVGINNKLIYNSSFNGEIIGSNYVGGISGENNGYIKNTYVIANISGGNKVGGITGNNGFAGEICEDYDRCNNDFGVRSSYFYGELDGNNEVGGIAGYNASLIIYSYVYAEITGNIKVGGIVGFDSGSLDYVFVLGSVKGITYIDSIYGYSNTIGSIKYAYTYEKFNVNGIIYDNSEFIVTKEQLSDIRWYRNYFDKLNIHGWDFDPTLNGYLPQIIYIDDQESIKIP